MLTILHLPGYHPTKYGSLEGYFLELARAARQRGHRLLMGFNDQPLVPAFIHDFERAGGQCLLARSGGLGAPGMGAWLIAACRRYRPDIVHLHFGREVAFGALCARLCGATVVRTKHGMSHKRGLRPHVLAEWLTAALAAQTLTVSDAVRDELIELGVPADKVTTMLLGVDLNRFTPGRGDHELRAQLRIRDDQLVIAVIARAEPVKGLSYLVDALPAIVAAEPKAVLLQVGGGEAEVTLREQARRLGVADHLICAGRRDDVDRLLRLVEVVALSSLSEGIGLVLMEAAAAARPIVATAVGGVPEAVREGETGLLVPARDPDRLAQALIALLRDPDRRRRMGAEGRALAQAEFDVRTHVGQLLDLYEDLPVARRKVARKSRRTIVLQAVGRERLEVLHRLDASQYLSADQLQAEQWERLRALLDHAYRHCAFYRRRFEQAGLLPDQISGPDELRLLPVLTPLDLQAHIDEMMADNHPRQDLLRTQTDGSSGEPVTLHFDRRCGDWRWAAQVRQDRWTGWELGDRVALLWSENHDLSGLRSLKQWVSTNLMDQLLVLDASDLSEAQLADCTVEVAGFQPNLVIASTGVMRRWAELVTQRERWNHSPRAIICTTDGLDLSARSVIEHTFGCKVFARYLSPELGVIASECPQHQGLHLNAENLYVEVLCGERPATPAEMGRVVVTDLGNYGMPLIRYQPGDLAAFAVQECACGRGLPLLARVIRGESLTTG